VVVRRNVKEKIIKRFKGSEVQGFRGSRVLGSEVQGFKV